MDFKSIENSQEEKPRGLRILLAGVNVSESLILSHMMRERIINHEIILVQHNDFQFVGSKKGLDLEFKAKEQILPKFIIEDFSNNGFEFYPLPINYINGKRLPPLKPKRY